MTTDTATPADVLVVGAGPVGKFLAVRLARRGHSIVLVDKQTRDYELPRAVTHDAEFARAFQSVGLAPDRIPSVTEPYDGMYVWQNADQRTLVEYDWRGRGESGWYNTYFFHQPDLEAELQRQIERSDSITVHRGLEYRRHAESADRVVAGFVDRSGRRHHLEARYLVGADGAHSRVAADIECAWHDQGYFHDWLVVDVVPRDGSRIPNVARQHCDPARPSTMVPGGPGRRRWEFMRLPEETIEEMNTAEFAWKLLAPFDVRPDTARLARHATYTFQAGWATRWRRGRILITGDAAHLMPPFAGQGLCAGIRDAMNLEWKLSAVLRGDAPTTLLDTYGPERIDHVARFIEFSTSLGDMVCVTDVDEATRRDRRLLDGHGDDPARPPRPRLGPGLHVGTHGGSLSVQGRVRPVGGPDDSIARLDDLTGPGILLLRHGVSDPKSERTTGLSAAGITVVALTAGVGGVPMSGGVSPVEDGVVRVEDVDRTYTRWLDDLDADCVLVRPDFYVFGAATAGETGALVDAFLARTSDAVSAS